MEDFERIKKLTYDAINNNIPNTTIIKQWKYQIRRSLMDIRDKFNQSIDKFIIQFGTVFKNVEMSNDLMEFRGEDKRLQK
jgi:hypothetical protein